MNFRAPDREISRSDIAADKCLYSDNSVSGVGSKIKREIKSEGRNYIQGLFFKPKDGLKPKDFLVQSLW